MPDATKRPIAEWRDTEWLQHLQRQARRLTACPYSADDLAHTCLIAFYDHHRRYPWQHPEPAHALRWCCQKLRALACDAHRYAERQPCLVLETLPESVACVDIAAQVQGDIDGERFVASLPPRLRAAVELRLASYSWDEAAQQLGVKASTLRGYLPELGAKFVEFFGYDPSNRASESLIRAEGKTAPQMIEEETQMKAILGLVNGFVTTLNTRGDKSPAEMGRVKRGGLRRTHTLYPRCKCLHRVIFNSAGALVGRKAGFLVITLLCLTISAAAQQGCPNCSCSGQWQTELVPPEPTRTVVSSTKHSGDNRYCAQVLVPALCLSGYEGIRVSGSACDNLDWGYDFWTRDTVRYKTECIPPEVVGPCQRYWRRIENVKESQSKVYKQDFQSFTDDSSRSQQVQAQAFVSDSSHPQDALIVIGVASTQERTFARNLLESTERSLQQIEVRANSAGYKVIRDGAVIYLISPSHWRDNMLLRLCHLAEQLSTVSPRDPLPISRVSSQSRALLHRWLTSQANRSRPREIAVAERLLADGVVWWSGLVQFEIYAGGQRYRGSFLLECTPSVPPHSVRGNQQSPTASSSLKAKTDDHSEVTILFSREVSENDCVRLSRNYLDLVARELQAAHERYEEVVLQMQRFLVSHFSMPEEWAEGKESPFATLPEWIKSRITEELRSYYAGKATDEIKDLLRGDSVKAAIQPVILIGGFVSEYSFESYGWGLSDLLGAASSHAETREGSLHGYASP